MCDERGHEFASTYTKLMFLPRRRGSPKNAEAGVSGLLRLLKFYGCGHEFKSGEEPAANSWRSMAFRYFWSIL